MSTYTQILYHIIFSTKDRRPVLDKPRREELFRYVWSICRNKECHLYRINGIEDHIHILASLHPSICLSDFIKEIKTSTNTWIKEKNVFPAFTYWQSGYGAFTLSYAEKDGLIEYIKNQQEHHKTESYLDELRRLLKAAGIEFDEKYLE
jgi:putative transposase